MAEPPALRGAGAGFFERNSRGIEIDGRFAFGSVVLVAGLAHLELRDAVAYAAQVPSAGPWFA